MKLVKRKTRKAIEKSVRKAMKRHGPAIVAALAGGLASSLATLANTDAPNKGGKSNLADMADQAKAAVTTSAAKPSRNRQARRQSHTRPSDDTEGTQTNDMGADAPHH